MVNQNLDKTNVRTAEDIEQKYNLSKLSNEIEKQIIINKNTSQELQQLNYDTQKLLFSIFSNVGDYIKDGIKLYFKRGYPTGSFNEGDIYYNKDDGKVYIYKNGTMEESLDNSLIQAMAVTNVQIDVEDGERRVFITTPTPPYNNGDWFFNEGTLYICQIERLTGEYEETDFVISSNYTYGTLANEVNNRLEVTKGRVLIIEQSVDEYSVKIAEVTEVTEETQKNVAKLTNITKKTTKEITDSNGEIRNLLIDGKSVQEGIPTPTEPIEIESLGKESANIFNKDTSINNHWLDEFNGQVANIDWCISDYIEVKPDTNYIQSGFTNLGQSPSTCFYDENKKFISGIKNVSSYTPPGNPSLNKREIITTPSNCKYVKISVQKVDMSTTQVEEGVISTDYYKFKNRGITINNYREDDPSNINAIEIPLAHTLKSVPSGVKDYFQSGDDNVNITRNVGEYIITGDESWDMKTYFDTYNYFALTFDIGQDITISNNNCNYFEQAKWWSEEKESIWFDSTMIIKTKESLSKNQTLIQFKEWLKEKYDTGNPVIIQYQLKEPTTESYAIDKLTLLEGDSYIELEDLVQDGLELDYYTTSELNNYANSYDVDSLEKEVNNNYQNLNNALNNYATNEKLMNVTNEVELLQTANDLTISIVEDIQVNGVSKVKTTTGYTFDEDGLEISKTGAKVSNILDETGMSILDKTGNTDSELMFAGYDEELGETIVRSKNINVEKYLTIGKNSRIEDFEDGTGIFYVGGGN